MMEESQMTLWDTEQEPSAGAVIVGPYRYTLWRQWNPTLPRALFIMLNPSTADAAKDDPTLRRCINFARSWCMGSIEVVNLYAYISAYPAVLKQAKDAIGAENDVYIQQAIRRASLIVCAWGACKLKGQRGTDVVRLLASREAYCLGFTKEQCPCHPLYKAGDTPLVRYV